MILMKWFNVYLTLDGFRLGNGFNSEPEAANQTDEFHCYHETTLIPTEIIGKPLYSCNARLRTYRGIVDNSVDKLYNSLQ